MPTTLTIRDPDTLAAAMAGWIAEMLGAAVRARGTGTIALAGGGTPRGVYEVLAAPPLRDAVPWGRVHVYFGDERAVPPDDPDSNFRMAREALLARVPVPPAQIHRMEAERADLEAAAAAYAQALPAALDGLLLGVGEDGHTASLFPGAPALGETARRVVPVVGPKPPPRRLTVTPPVIAAARSVGVIAVGAGKAEAVARALEAPLAPRETPAQLARGGHWFLDPAAAARLRQAVGA